MIFVGILFMEDSATLYYTNLAFLPHNI